MKSIDKIFLIKNQYIERVDDITEQDLINCKLLVKEGREYYLRCVSFKLFISLKYFTASICEGQTPITNIYLTKAKDLDLLIQVLKDNKEIA